MTGHAFSEVSCQDDIGLAELARFRQGCYRFAAALFLYPGQGRMTKLAAASGELKRTDDSLVPFPFFGPWQRLLTTLRGVVEEGGMAEAEEEYVRLFLVTPQALPYESFYLDPQRRATGWILAQLEGEYAERGLALSPSLRETPDHVAVELEFMAFLCDLEAQAWERRDLREGRQALKWQQGFLDQHLKRWFPSFARQVAAAGEESLYALAAEAANALIQNDRDLTALLLERSEALRRSHAEA